MKTVIKTVASVAVAGGLMFAGVAFASAATISNPLFSNGDTTISATGGSTVSGTFTLEVNANEVCEVIRTQADGSQPIKDTSVGGQLGYQEGTYTSVPFSVKAPPNTGTYWPQVQCAGIWGGIRSIDGNDNVVVGPQNLGELRVTASGSSTSGDPILSGSDKLDQLIALLTAWMAKSAKPAYCASMVAYNGSNAYAAQAWLFSTPHKAVFTSNGVHAPTGNWKSISMQAAAEANAACI